MSDDETFPAEAVVRLAEKAGLDVSDLKRQLQQRDSGSSVDALAARLAQLEREVRSPSQPEPGRALADALNEAQSKWIVPGQERGDDAA